MGVMNRKKIFLRLIAALCVGLLYLTYFQKLVVSLDETLSGQILVGSFNVCFQMEAQNRNLRKELEQAQNSTREIIDRLTSEIHEKQSLIEVLKAQVVLYREDFENERQDRQQAQSRLVVFEAELDELTKTAVSVNIKKIDFCCNLCAQTPQKVK